MSTSSPSTFARTQDTAQRSGLTDSTAREVREPRIDHVEADRREPRGIDTDVELVRAVSAERSIVSVPVERRAPNACASRSGAQRGFQPWLPAADKARATSRALQNLGDEEL